MSEHLWSEYAVAVPVVKQQSLKKSSKVWILIGWLCCPWILSTKFFLLNNTKQRPGGFRSMLWKINFDISYRKNSLIFYIWSTNKAKQSFSNDREHGKLRTFLSTKAKQLLTVWRLPDDFLMTSWRLPDDCLTTAWQLLTNAWQLCISNLWYTDTKRENGNGNPDQRQV